MINVPYLLKLAKTTKLSEFVTLIDSPALDMNLAMWDAIDAGQIEINENKDRINLLVDAETWHSPEISSKLLRTIQHYVKNETNITRGRMNALMKDPVSGLGYPMHEYLMSLQYLIDEGQVIEAVVEVPKTGKRPYHKFVFLCLDGNDNEEWNAKAVNKWIDGFAQNKVK